MKSYDFAVHAQSDEAEVTISDKSENFPQNCLQIDLKRYTYGMYT